VSTEGRAQMLRNAEAMQAVLDDVRPCHCPRGLPHVEAYVRAATQAPEEMMLWIQDNYSAYAYRHMHGLVVQTFSSMVFKSRLRDAVGFIDDLYGISPNGAGAGGGGAGVGDGSEAGVWGQGGDSTTCKDGGSSSGRGFGQLFDPPSARGKSSSGGIKTMFKMGF